MDVKVYLRHYQNHNIQGDPIVYVGTSPQTLYAQVGSVPQTQWVDYTSQIGNIEQMRFSWSTEINSEGTSTQGAFEKKRSVTGSLQMLGSAYTFIKDWLVNNISAPFNAIEVRFELVGCGDIRDFKIGCSQIEWKEADICQFNVTPVQTDESYTCIQKTLIHDNWQGWFNRAINPDDASAKRHPRFSYCNEMRPNAMLIIMWYLLRTLFDIAAVIAYLVATIINPIILIINAIIWLVNVIVDVINAIASILGTGNADVMQEVGFVGYFYPEDFLDHLINLYVESAGCGREHPAPLIRDYIKNVCDKCGIVVDEITAPIFFASSFPNLTTSHDPGTPVSIYNPHYFACYLNADSQRGVRRFDKITWFNDPPKNDYQFWIPENAPVLTLDMFLDKLKTIYNAEWRIKNGKLFFWRRDWYLQNANNIVYNFAANGADRSKILDGVSFSWNEIKQPGSVKGIYALDAADTCGNEATHQQNGYASFGLYDNNPNFEGIMDKETQFGAAKFRLDGAGTDYLFDTVQQLLNGQLLNPSTTAQMQDVVGKLDTYADYCLLLKDETCTLPKILIWDPNTGYMNAKAAKDWVPMQTDFAGSIIPEINYNYPVFYDSNGNPHFDQWKDRHWPLTHVLGRGLYWGDIPDGVYKAGVYFGMTVYEKPARLVNYPMYFEPCYQGTLWDWFHWIDDPRRNPSLRQNFEVKIKLCCDDLTNNRLGVLNGAEDIALLEKVKLDRQYYPEGLITHIEVVLDSKDTLGKHILIKGKS